MQDRAWEVGELEAIVRNSRETVRRGKRMRGRQTQPSRYDKSHTAKGAHTHG